MFWKSKKLEEYKLEEDPTYHEYCSNHPLANEIEFEWQLNTPIDEDYPDDYCKDCPECKKRSGQVKTYKGWEKIGLPMSNLLPCGDNCSCSMWYDKFGDNNTSKDENMITLCTQMWGEKKVTKLTSPSPL